MKYNNILYFIKILRDAGLKMKKIEANSLTLKQVKEALKANFQEDTFKIFWDKDTLCLYFKEGTGELKRNVFISMVSQFIPELSVSSKVIAVDSGFWK